MIDKTIHYCWFGKRPLPKLAKKCIRSWKKYFPDYSIKEWNEDNYDVRKIPYIAQAYEKKKYAFVSDYARFDILYKYGGVYFDTDVEVIKSFEDVLESPFMGCETDGKETQNENTVRTIEVNPGLGMAAIPGMDIYKRILDYYATELFCNEDGSINEETIVEKTTKVLLKYGLQDTMKIQNVAGITVYPKEYFAPIDYYTGVLRKTNKTHSIHWYSKSWISPKGKIKGAILRRLRRIIGTKNYMKIRSLFGRLR